MNRAALVSSWRVALRIARRSALRHRGRSALVLLMLFTPAYAGTVLVAGWNNLSGTSAQETTFSMGRADLIIESDDIAAIVAALPSGSRTTALTQARTIVGGPGGLRVSEYEAADLTNAINQGRYVLRAGRAPHGPAEAAVTRAAADSFGLRLGSHLTAGIPQRDLTVVGLADWSRSLHASGLLVPHDAPLSAERGKLMVRLPDGHRWTPPGTSSGAVSVRARETMAPTAAERRIEAAAAMLVVSFAGAQVVLLVGAAFVVGAARQRRELALVVAAGATRRQVGRIVLASGVLLGSAAAAAALILGVLTFAAAGPLLERIADHPLIDVRLPVRQLVGVTAVTVTVAILAALLPTRMARHRPVRNRLGGQRTGSRLDHVGLVVGVVLIAVGTAALVISGNPEGRAGLLAVGGIAQLLGIVACTPTLVHATGRLAGVLPMPGRLALRHAMRHRLRTAAAVAAVTAAIAGSVAVALAGAAGDEAAPTRLDARPGQVLVPPDAAQLLGARGLEHLAAALPARDTVTLRTATKVNVTLSSRNLPGSPTDPTAQATIEQREIAVGGAEVIQLVTGRAAIATELTALDRGHAVAFNDTLVVRGHVTLAQEARRPTSLPAIVAARQEYFTRLPGLLVSPTTADQLELAPRPRLVVVDTTRAPDRREVAAANAVLLQAQVTATTPPRTPITVEAVAAEEPTREVTTMFYPLAAVSVLVTLVASTVAVGLATVELRPDLATMAAVGATNRIRRRISMAQALVVVGVGAILGLTAGIGPAAAYVGYNVELHWHVPWLALLAIVLAPPLLATIVARSLTRDRFSLVRRTS